MRSDSGKSTPTSEIFLDSTFHPMLAIKSFPTAYHSPTYFLELPPPISCPNLYPAILSHSIFCLVIGNCLLKPLKAPSLRLLKPLLISSWYLFSAVAISRTIPLADEDETD